MTLLNMPLQKSEIACFNHYEKYFDSALPLGHKTEREGGRVGEKNYPCILFTYIYLWIEVSIRRLLCTLHRIVHISNAKKILVIVKILWVGNLFILNVKK